MENMELQDGTSVAYHTITKEEYLALVKLAGQPIQDYLEKYDIEVRSLSDGRIIGTSHDYYVVYASMSDFKRVVEDFDQNSGKGTEILLNKNIYGENFPLHTKELIRDLLESLEMPSEAPSAYLMVEIDRKIDGMPDGGAFKRKHIMNFIALLGDLLRMDYGATWDMKLATDGTTWNPYMTIKGQNVEFFGYLYEDIFLKNDSKKILDEIYHTMKGIVKMNLK